MAFTPLGTKPAVSDKEIVTPVRVAEKKTLTGPNKNVRIIDPAENEYIPVINIGLMGLPSTGKTMAIAELVRTGARVFMINTDAGGTGEETIAAAARKGNYYDKFVKNFKGISFSSHDDSSDFFDNPLKLYPKFYDFDPDFIIWEGFSNWQQTQLSEKVSELYVETFDSNDKNRGKDASEQRAEGFKYETQDWGLIRNGTVRRLEEFLQMFNKKTGRWPSHILTMQEAVMTEQVTPASGGLPQSVEKASGRPLVQGAGKNFIGQGFSLVLRTLQDKDGGFWYENSVKTLGLTKNRGIDLPEGKFKADFVGIIDKIEAAYGVKLYERS